MSEPLITTFGCRLNSFESEIMRGHAARAGLDDVVIIHSCAVTAEAERQVRQAIRRARRDHPAKRVVVTGCAVQIDPRSYSAMAEVDLVVGNADKLKPESWQALKNDPAGAPQVADIMASTQATPPLVEGFAGRSRAFLQVQNGCDHRCTFCIIPYGRGNSRSVPVANIIAQARQLVASNYQEIIVTGVDITSYGKDLPGAPALGAMLKELLAAIPNLPRLRLSSIDPAELDPDLLELIADEPRLMPHLHLSLQAGDDMVLKRMKRRHSRSQALELTHKLRALRPNLALGADLIAGFPTEDEAMFQATHDFILEAGLAHLHVFPYSERPGTPAVRMPQVPKSVRKERARLLRAAGERGLARYLSAQIGRPQKVLVERHGNGLSEGFATCKLPGGAAIQAGTIVDFVPERAVDGMLEGAVTNWIKAA